MALIGLAVVFAPDTMAFVTPTLISADRAMMIAGHAMAFITRAMTISSSTVVNNDSAIVIYGRAMANNDTAMTFVTSAMAFIKIAFSSINQRSIRKGLTRQTE
ncbi:MAG: hypothetical protein Q8909_15490 [Bacteroidota bacterium]|nr:hypothetical protein [Bacteroidota bacterium]